MIVAVDTNILIYFLEKNASAPIDAVSKQVIEDGHERIQLLISEIGKAKGKIIVPTPVLAEILVKAGSAGPSWLAIMEKSSVFKIADFDKRAAFEFAQTHVESLKNRRDGEERHKVKFDDQILAISNVHGATILYSDDKGIKSRSSDRLQVVSLSEMRRPQKDPQMNLDFEIDIS